MNWHDILTNKTYNVISPKSHKTRTVLSITSDVVDDARYVNVYYNTDTNISMQMCSANTFAKTCCVAAVTPSVKTLTLSDVDFENEVYCGKVRFDGTPYDGDVIIDAPTITCAQFMNGFKCTGTLTVKNDTGISSTGDIDVGCDIISSFTVWADDALRVGGSLTARDAIFAGHSIRVSGNISTEKGILAGDEITAGGKITSGADVVCGVSPWGLTYASKYEKNKITCEDIKYRGRATGHIEIVKKPSAKKLKKAKKSCNGKIVTIDGQKYKLTEV